MTIDALHPSAERSLEPESGSVAIGEPDANIFLCPECSRPLSVGAARCARCGTRLVAGVPLRKVSGFVGLGLVAGLLVGGGVGAVTLLSGSVAAPVPVPSAAAIPSAVPTSVAPIPSVAPAAPQVPPVALSALRQSTIVNQRLLADRDLLARAMAVDAPSAADIAPLLRTLASTAAFGDRLAPTVGTWEDGAAVSRQLAAFYAAVDRVADDGLAASIANERAYIDAGRRMLAVLDGLTDLDAASRRLAGTVDVELPPLTPATD
jgi:hypothetical protein